MGIAVVTSEERAMPWLVIICREGEPTVTVFSTEIAARVYFNAASLQWSDSFLAQAVEAPLDWQGTP